MEFPDSGVSVDIDMFWKKLVLIEDSTEMSERFDEEVSSMEKVIDVGDGDRGIRQGLDSMRW